MAVPVMIVGAVMGVVGALRSANAKAAADRYNGKVAEQNAAIATSQGEAAAQAQQRDAERQMGRGMAAYGASGVSLDSGSPTDVLADSARSAMLDNLTVRYNATLRGTAYKDQAALSYSEASNDMTSGYLNAASSVVSAAGKMYGAGGGTGMTMG
jgi:hypothetical protein